MYFSPAVERITIRREMNVRIAYISDERFPSAHTDTQQVMKTLDALGGQGAEVDFIQPRMAQHIFKSKEDRKKEICHYYNIEGRFEIDDILSWPASGLRIEKLFHGFAAPLKALMGKYDVIYTRNIIPVTMVSRLRLPVLFETYRALPLSNPWSWRAVKAATSGARFLGISTHSEYSRDVMIDAGISPDIIRAVPNGFDPADFVDAPSMEDARKTLDLPFDEKIAIYTGQIRSGKGIHTLLDMAAENKGFTMFIVGGFDNDVAELRKEISSRGLQNVQTTGQVPIKMVPTYLAAADVLVLPTTAKPLMSAGSTVLPMKTFTYIAAGKPILAPDLPDTRGVLNHNENCLKVTPDSPTDASAALQQLFSDSELATRLASQAQKDASLFTWDGRAKRLLSFLEERLAIVR